MQQVLGQHALTYVLASAHPGKWTAQWDQKKHFQASPTDELAKLGFA